MVWDKTERACNEGDGRVVEEEEGVVGLEP